MKRILLLSGMLFIVCIMQGQDIFKKHGFTKEPLTLSKGRYKEVFTNDEVVQIGTVLLNTRTNKIVGFLEEDTAQLAYKEELSSRFLSIDPLAEKYPWMSPYAYCMNNPVRFIDPDGRDVYRYDHKTGDLILTIKNDDKFDQIGKFKHNKDTDTYTLRTNKKGEAKTQIDNIEKGLLSDGVNFKNSDNVINIGGDGQASVVGFEEFITQFSDMVGKEISGYYLTDIGGSDIKYVGVAHYSNNKRDEAKGAFMLYRARPDLYGKVSHHTDYHTHPSDAAESDKLHPSDTDYRTQAKTRQYHPQVKRFIILTTGYNPIEY